MTVAIGMFQPKDTRNLGSLVRSADLYDVDFTFQIGGVEYNRPAATDTAKASRRVPHFRYENLADLTLVDAELVAIELDTHAVPLGKFYHPRNALYLLGSENHGIPRNVLDQCGRIVQVETVKRWPLNVATAGAIVLHDRLRHDLGAAA